MDLKPTKEELKWWLLNVIKHSCNVEYYRYYPKMELSPEDPEKPHDIEGIYNKLSLPVIKGLCIQNRDKSKGFYTKYILPSINLHRRQYHHKIRDDKLFGEMDFIEAGIWGVDVLCSHLEDRGYQGGAKTFKELPKIIKENNNPFEYMLLNTVYHLMEEKTPPHLEKITSLTKFPNIGLPQKTYKKIKYRILETIEMLKENGYPNFPY